MTNTLDYMLERNKDFAARQSAAGHIDALAPAGTAECEGDHHRLRRYASGPGSHTRN